MLGAPTVAFFLDAEWCPGWKAPSREEGRERKVEPTGAITSKGNIKGEVRDQETDDG
jgi:hypothetical protein